MLLRKLRRRERGKLADIVIFDDNALSHAGAANRIGAIFSCAPLRVWYSIINGKIVVERGELVTADERGIVKDQNMTAKKVLK